MKQWLLLDWFPLQGIINMFFKFILGTKFNSSSNVQVEKTTETCIIQWYLVYFTNAWCSQGSYINQFT